MRPVIVVTGSLNMDFVVRVERFPAPGETIAGSGFQTAPGGKGANQAFAAARLSRTAEVRMLGIAGRDVSGAELLRSLDSAGCLTAHVEKVNGTPTGAALIAVNSQGENTIVVAAGGNALLTPEYVSRHADAFAGATVALFQLETPLGGVAAALSAARQQGAFTILDPAPARPLQRELLKLVDLLTPNESEACQLLNWPVRKLTAEAAIQAAHELQAAGAASVAVTLGEAGCVLISPDGEVLHVPAHRVQAVDSTAAGDTFNAALAVALSESRALPEALRFASAAAGICVTREGAQPSIPSRDETEALLAAAPNNQGR